MIINKKPYPELEIDLITGVGFFYIFTQIFCCSIIYEIVYFWEVYMKTDAKINSCLKVMTYNIRHGAGMDLVVDLKRIAGVINSQNPHIVALQEVDKNANRSGNVDETAELARLTGMNYYKFSRAIDFDGGEYGDAILSRLPFRVVNSLFLPGLSETYEGLFVEVDVSSLFENGKKITFINTHLDYEDAQNRIKSVRDIEACYQTLPSLPAIICGDFNDHPDSAVLKEFKLNWAMENMGKELLSYPSDVPEIQIDYILLRNNCQLVMDSIEVINETITSDHRPLVACVKWNE